MNTQEQHEFKQRAEAFWALRTKKRDDSGKAVEPLLPHDAFDHLHEGADVASDPEMSFCPMCHQDFIVKRLTELAGVNATFVAAEVPGRVVEVMTEQQHEAAVAALQEDVRA